MDRDLTEQALRPALWGAVGIGAALYGMRSAPVAGGFLAGAVWNVVNLALLRALAQAWAREEGRQVRRLLLAKVLILYPVGLALAMSGAYSLVGMLAGFSWVFIIIIGLATWSACTENRRCAVEPPRG